MAGGGLGNIGAAFVTVELDFDNAVREAKQAGAHIPPIDLRVEVDQTQATASVRAALAKASAAAGAIPVRVNRASLAAASAQIRTSISGAFASAGRLGSAALLPGALAVGVLGYQLKKGAEDAKKLSVVTSEVDQAIRLFGKNSGVTADQIGLVSGEFKNLTSISGSSIKSAEASLLKFGATNRKNLKETTGLLLDTAVGMRQVSEDGKVSATFATKFGRALQDPTKGLALLARGGAPVSAALRDNVKEMQKAGKTAEATALVTGLLREKFKGAAATFGTTIGGQLRIARFKFEEARRDLATRILPSIVPIIAQVGGEIANSLKKNEKPIAAFVTNFVRSAGAVIRFITTSKEFHRVMSGIAKVVSGFAVGFRGFAQNFAKAFSKRANGGAKSFGETMQELGKTVGAFAATWLPRLGTALGVIAGVIAKTRVGFAFFIGVLTSAKFLGIRATFAFLADAVIAVGSAFVAVFGAVPLLIAGAVAALVILYAKFRIVRKVVNSLIPVFVGIVAGPLAGMAAMFVLLWKRSERFRDVVSGVVKAVRGSLGWLRERFAEWRAGIAVILDGVRAKFGSWRDGIRGVITSVREAISRFGERVRSILDIDLFALGRKIILSLLRGLKDGWKEVSGWLSERAGIIKKLKGPIDLDRRLLVDEGGAIMGGFFKGLKKRWTGIADWLSGVGSYFKGVISGNDIEIGNILLGKGGIGDLNKQLGNAIGIPWLEGSIGTGGLGGFLHPTSGWADTLAQLRILERMFGTSLSSGLRSYDTVPGPGVSQHTLGQAGDEVGSAAAMTNLARFASKMPGIFRQVIWLNRLWANGFPTSTFIPDHMDHVHLGWQARAAGGQVRKGRAYQWNERGKEMLMPSGNGYVMNASRTKELVSAIKDLSKRPASSRSSNAEIHVHSNAADPVAVGGLVMSNLGAVFSRA